MVKISKFLLYGEGDPSVEKSIQYSLNLREWSELETSEKEIALQELKNNQWLESYSKDVLWTIEYLNQQFLRQCPGKHLHRIKPETHSAGSFGNESERAQAAQLDFQHIFLNEKSNAMVLRMLSKFAESYIDGYSYQRAVEAKNEEEKEKYLASAFERFDPLTNCLNHIFEQFSVNQILTRSGFVPRQDEKIAEQVYVPTLQILANPKWKTVSESLASMFEDYRDEDYPETITKAHSSVQRFLQTLVGEEGKNGRGEVGKLFSLAKQEQIIPINRFTEPIMTVFQGYMASERATNSTAKPALKTASASDALLMMNVVMIFIQFCLQKTD